jgi:hypothetical protein
VEDFMGEDGSARENTSVAELRVPESYAAASGPMNERSTITDRALDKRGLGDANRSTHGDRRRIEGREERGHCRREC